MKKFMFIFNAQTIIFVCLSLASSFISLYFQFKMYLDYLIVGVIIAFPLTFSMREAFKRRERAVQYLCLFKASLQSVYYCSENSKLDSEKKLELRNILTKTSYELIKYLANPAASFLTVQNCSVSFFEFIQTNKESMKNNFLIKILLFFSKVNESVEFLSATKRHQTPHAVRLIVLFGMYLFVIFYPASLLNQIGFDVTYWYVFVMTVTKALLLICLYNVQSLLEDPFNQNSPDAIRLNDFQFSGLPLSTVLLTELNTDRTVDNELDQMMI